MTKPVRNGKTWASDSIIYFLIAHYAPESIWHAFRRTKKRLKCWFALIHRVIQIMYVRQSLLNSSVMKSSDAWHIHFMLNTLFNINKVINTNTTGKFLMWQVIFSIFMNVKIIHNDNIVICRTSLTTELLILRIIINSII